MSRSSPPRSRWSPQRRRSKPSSKNELDYDVFVDETGDVVRDFRLGFQLDDNTQTRYKGYGIDLASFNTNGAWELPAPAVYVIDRQGTIRYASADWDYSSAPPRAGRQALAAVRDQLTAHPSPL